MLVEGTPSVINEAGRSFWSVYFTQLDYGPLG